MNDLRVVYIPYWPKENPYQRLLLGELQKLGLKIETYRARGIFSVLFECLFLKRPHILHLHCQHSFLVSNFRLISVIKSLTFIFFLAVIRLLGVKVVWTVHEIRAPEYKYRNLERLFLVKVARLAQAVIVHCERAKLEITEALKVSEIDKIAVIPHGNYLDIYPNKISRLEARKKLLLPKSSFVFLYLGFIRPNKGIPELIEAFSSLETLKAVLIVAGKSHRAEIAERIKKKAQSRSNIKVILKFIPEDEVQVFMNSADVAVFPYRDILTSGGIILAMSFGKAVIAPNLGCVPEILASSGGFIYDPKVPGSLLKVMREALEAKPKLLEMGKGNLERVRKLAWKEIALSTFEIYKKCQKF